MKINKKLIKELVENLEEFKLTDLEYSEKDMKIKVSRQSKASQNISPEITIEKNNKKTEIVSGTEIKSPIIGTAISPLLAIKIFLNIFNRLRLESVHIQQADRLQHLCS